jgi:hypothetical protein
VVVVLIRPDLVERRPDGGDPAGLVRRRIQDASVLAVIAAVQLLWLTLLVYEAAALLLT